MSAVEAEPQPPSAARAVASNAADGPPAMRRASPRSGTSAKTSAALFGFSCRRTLCKLAPAAAIGAVSKVGDVQGDVFRRWATQAAKWATILV